MKIKLMPLLSILCFAAMVSCKKNETVSGAPPSLTITNKSYNPYSVTNMRKALAGLLAGDAQLSRNNKLGYVKGKMILSTKEGIGINKQMTLNESLKIAEQGITATHYYIKFIPRNQADMDKLKVDSSLTIYPFPLDNEQTQYKGSYHDPSVSPGVPTYQYAAVPVAYRLPDVPYQKLEDLYIPNESKPGNRVTVTADGNSSYSVETGELARSAECGGGEVGGGGEGEPINEEVLDEYDDCEGGGGPYPPNDPYRNGENWRPHGRITVNDDLKGIIGVEGIRVRARRWFTTYNGFTDADGYYAVDGWFTRPANYWLDFERYEFQVTDGTNGLGTAREISGPKIEAAWDVQFDGYDKFCSTIFRAAYHYYYKDIQGLQRPPENAFWHTQMKLRAKDYPDPDAPLSGGNAVAQRRILNLGEFIHIYHPSFADTRRTYATTIHELAHAVHWKIDHSHYNNNDLATNMMAESWARGAEWFLTKMEYSDYRGGNVVLPEYTNVVIDMIDFNFDNSNNGYSDNRDFVFGYNIIQIQDALNGAANGTDWKNNIRNNYDNNTENNLDALFSAWGF